MKVRGVGVDRVCLGGNSDTVGMHELQKIASLIEFMRNFLVLCGMPMSVYCVATILEIVGLI